MEVTLRDSKTGFVVKVPESLLQASSAAPYGRLITDNGIARLSGTARASGMVDLANNLDALAKVGMGIAFMLKPDGTDWTRTPPPTVTKTTATKQEIAEFKRTLANEVEDYFSQKDE